MRYHFYTYLIYLWYCESFLIIKYYLERFIRGPLKVSRYFKLFAKFIRQRMSPNLVLWVIALHTWIHIGILSILMNKEVYMNCLSYVFSYLFIYYSVNPNSTDSLLKSLFQQSYIFSSTIRNIQGHSIIEMLAWFKNIKKIIVKL